MMKTKLVLRIVCSRLSIRAICLQHLLSGSRQAGCSRSSERQIAGDARIVHHGVRASRYPRGSNLPACTSRKRRANPMVRRPGSEPMTEVLKDLADSPRHSACSTARRRTNSAAGISGRDEIPRAPHRRHPRSLPDLGLPAVRSCQPAPGVDRRGRNICGASQVGTSTPLVICRMGTASSDLAGVKRCPHRRETPPHEEPTLALARPRVRGPPPSCRIPHRRWRILASKLTSVAFSGIGRGIRRVPKCSSI